MPVGSSQNPLFAKPPHYTTLGMASYIETLAYWYLRLNGFFPLRNFVLHPLHESTSDDNQTADCDLLAVRFPHVYEEIGGQSGDWDSRFNTWGFSLDEDIIGLIVEVKTSPNAVSARKEGNSFRRSRLSQAVQRMGMFAREETTSITDELLRNPISTKQGPYRIGKLLFSQKEMEAHGSTLHCRSQSNSFETVFINMKTRKDKPECSSLMN